MNPTGIFTKQKRRQLRNAWITIFVIVWTLAFHYESTRFFYLDPLFGTHLPKIKFLFPPAGWIMFYHVEDSFGTAEVYQIKNGRMEFIDPHKIFETKAVLYDNIHRNVLSSVIGWSQKKEFCRFLKRKFPGAEGFIVMVTYYPSVTQTPKKKLYRIEYICR